MKTLKKLMGLALAFAFVASVSVFPALATDVTVTPVPQHKYEGNDSVHKPASEKYLEEVKGEKITFKKFLVMSAGDEVPNVTFSYTIAAGTAISTDTSDNDYMQVDAGIMTNIVQPTDTVFGPGTAANPTETYTAVRKDNTTNAEIDIDVKRTAEDRKTGLTAATGVQFETDKGEKYAVQTSEIDFSNVTFVEPGIYRYIITETANATHEAAGIMHDNHQTRILDVYVVDENVTAGTGETATQEGRLKIAAYVLHKGKKNASGEWVPDNVAIGTDMGSADVASDGTALNDKTDGFTNEYKSVDLAVKKEVTGNQASRDKYFKVTVAITDAAASTEYKVSIAADDNANTYDGYADATTGTNDATIAANQGATNVTSITTDANGAKTQDFYLQHGQSIVIRGLPANAVYTVSETPEDYKEIDPWTTGATLAVNQDYTITNYKNKLTGTLSVQDTVDDNGGSNAVAADGLVRTGFLNKRDGIIPTGLIKVLAPAAGVIALAIVGLAIVMMNKRREEEDAE